MIVLGLLAAAFLQDDTDWKQAATANTGAIYSVQLSSIKPVSDTYRGPAKKAWVRIDYRLDKSHKAREAKVLFYIKCDEEQQRWASWIDYDAQGSVIESNTGATSYSPIPPGSVGAGIMEVVCN